MAEAISLSVMCAFFYPGTDLAALLAGPDASLDQAALAANTDLNEKLRNLLGLDGILLQRVEGRLVLQLSPSP